MSFVITIKNVPDKELGNVLALLSPRLPRGCTYETTHFNDTVGLLTGPKSGKKRPTDETLLTMTGKTPSREGPLQTALTMFEKLEGRKGIGAVTRGAFKDHLERRNQDPMILRRLVTEGYMGHLT